MSTKNIRPNVYSAAFMQAEGHFKALRKEGNWSFALATIALKAWSAKADAPEENTVLRMRKWLYAKASRFDRPGRFHIIGIPQFVVSNTGRNTLPKWKGRLVLIVALWKPPEGRSALEHFQAWFAVEGPDPKLEASEINKGSTLADGFRQLAAIEAGDFCIVASDDRARAKHAPHERRLTVRRSQSVRNRKLIFTCGMKLVGQKLEFEKAADTSNASSVRPLPKPTLLLDPNAPAPYGSSSSALASRPRKKRASRGTGGPPDDPYGGLDPPLDF